MHKPLLRFSDQRLKSVCFLLILLGCLIPAHKGTAQTSAYAIIDQVNLLRASYGLAPYSVDSGLMSVAQGHASYMASIQTATHNRADGSTPWQLGYEENIATGMLGFLTPENAVFSIWQDAIHMKTMVGYASGSIGAGVANDGTDEYYAIDVRPIGESVSSGGNNTGNGDSASFTPIPTIPVVPLMTSTAHPDGSLVHLVGYGQTLWSIADAYHITIDQIRYWNQLDDNSANIYAGQLLLVWPLSLVTQSATPTITPTILTSTPTRPPNTATPTQTATVTQTPTVTPTPTPKSLLQTVKDANINPTIWGGGLLLLVAVLAVVFMRRGITITK